MLEKLTVFCSYISGIIHIFLIQDTHLSCNSILWCVRVNIFTIQTQQFFPFLQLAKYFAVNNIINIGRCDMEKRKFVVALYMSLPAIWNNLRSSCKVHDIWGSVKRTGFSRQIFIKLLNIKFHFKLFSVNRNDTRTDRWTDTEKLIGFATLRRRLKR